MSNDIQHQVAMKLLRSEQDAQGTNLLRLQDDRKRAIHVEIKRKQDSRH